MAGASGFEPKQQQSKCRVLPLHYAPSKSVYPQDVKEAGGIRFYYIIHYFLLFVNQLFAPAVKLIANATIANTHWDEFTFKLGIAFDNQIAHFTDNCLCCRVSHIAKAFIGYCDKFFGIHIPNHIDRGVLRCFCSVIVVLAVIALRLDIRLGVNVSDKMNRDIRRQILKQKRELHISNRAMSCS